MEPPFRMATYFFQHALEAARQLRLRCLILSIHDEHLPDLQSGRELNLPIKKWTTQSAVLYLKKLLMSQQITERCHYYSQQIDFRKTEQRICKIVEEMLP